MPDKVLFIGHYRERSGWGKAARGYIHALKAAGFDVAARPVILSGGAPVDQTILEAEEKDSYGARFLIQHLLPHHMEYSGEFEKCIGIADLDSTNLEYSGWIERLNLMDEVWVPNWDSATDLSIEISKPIKTVPHAFDISVYQKEYEKIDIPVDENTVKFYTIADLNRRKNLSGILKAFHLAFPTDYNVALIIKVSKFKTDPNVVYEEVNNLSNLVKQGLRLYPKIEDYHKEIIIPDDAPEEVIYSLHSSADVYVSASHSEAWCIPAFEAMAFGNTVIASNTGGPKDYLGKGHYLVGGNSDAVFGVTDTFNNLFTSREDWFTPDIRKLADAMKEAYGETRPNTWGLKYAEEYSYSGVGKILKGLLR